MMKRQDQVPARPKRDVKTLVICDFDGTVSRADVGHRFMNRFTGNRWQDIDKGYCDGKIGSKEAYAKGMALYNGTREEALAFCLETERIDPGFAAFYRFCRERNADLIIASDGFDFYIEAVLDKYGLSEIVFFSNHAVFDGDGRMNLTFPHASADCGLCGTCKKAILTARRGAYDRIIYVGDGSSDVCPSREADLVFAKRTLYEKCRQNGTPCIRFDGFRDVRAYLTEHGILR